MSFKVTGIGDAGNSARFGSDDLDKINRILNGEPTGVTIEIDVDWIFQRNRLKLRDDGDNNDITIQTSEESGDWIIAIPTLGANRVPVFTDLSQELKSKIINLSDNTVTADEADTGDLIIFNGSKYDRFAKGTSNKYLKVKSDGSGLEWGDGSEGGTTALAGLTDDTEIDDPQDLDILIYNDDDSVWQNKSQSELVVDWSQVDNKPDTFAPQSHNHPVGEISGSGGSEGQVIKIVSGNPAWATDATGEGSGITNISDANDTNFTSLSDGQIMEFDDGSNNWVNVDHDHSAEFADIEHDHDEDYADIDHDHDEDYAALGHDHSGVYSTTSHHHDSDYADIDHSHAYSAITDKPSTFAPSAHASSHKTGQSDAIKLDELAAPDDNANLNATTSAHGLLKKLNNDPTKYMDGQGNWTTPDGTGGDGGGATALSDLTDDVDIDDPQEGDVLILNGDDLWVNKPQSDLSIDWNSLTSVPSDFPPSSHDHDSDYADIDHDHDSDYADIDHDHDSDYATIGHDHDGTYATSGHNHSGVYSTVSHNHDGSYSATSHTHAYSAITDKPSTFAPSAHASSHSSGQSDEVSLSNLAGTVSASQIANDAVETLAIKDLQVTGAKIANNTIDWRDKVSIPINWYESFLKYPTLVYGAYFPQGESRWGLLNDKGGAGTNASTQSDGLGHRRTLTTGASSGNTAYIAGTNSSFRRVFKPSLFTRFYLDSDTNIGMFFGMASVMDGTHLHATTPLANIHGAGVAIITGQSKFQFVINNGNATPDFFASSIDVDDNVYFTCEIWSNGTNFLGRINNESPVTLNTKVPASGQTMFYQIGVITNTTATRLIGFNYIVARAEMP